MTSELCTYENNPYFSLKTKVVGSYILLPGITFLMNNNKITTFSFILKSLVSGRESSVENLRAAEIKEYSCENDQVCTDIRLNIREKNKTYKYGTNFSQSKLGIQWCTGLATL